jgi:hypothetical protein
VREVNIDLVGARRTADDLSINYRQLKHHGEITVDATFARASINQCVNVIRRNCGRSDGNDCRVERRIESNIYYECWSMTAKQRLPCRPIRLIVKSALGACHL